MYVLFSFFPPAVSLHFEETLMIRKLKLYFGITEVHEFKNAAPKNISPQCGRLASGSLFLPCSPFAWWKTRVQPRANNASNIWWIRFRFYTLLSPYFRATIYLHTKRVFLCRLFLNLVGRYVLLWILSFSSEVISSIVANLEMTKISICRCKNILTFDICHLNYFWQC